MNRTATTLLTSILLTALIAGCGPSPLLKGHEAFHDGDYKMAAAQWTPLAESGSVHAQHNLGVLNKTLGDYEAAAFWWEQAASREFFPSMLELGALDLAAGEPDEAEAHYRRAARWGSSDAVAVLEALGKPVPSADLLWSKERLEMQRRNRIRELGRTDAGKFDPDEFLNRKLDYYAALVGDG